MEAFLHQDTQYWNYMQDEEEGEAQSLHMNLLQALLCAGVHSRAAYGYAMAAGHLSSLLNFALLQTVGSRTPLMFHGPRPRAAQVLTVRVSQWPTGLLSLCECAFLRSLQPKVWVRGMFKVEIV